MEVEDLTSMELAIKKSLISRNKLAIILQGDDGQPTFCCIECPAKFTDKDKLEIHVCSEHDREYRLLCKICGTGLKRKEHLDRHLLGHQEVRPHVCADCGKGFKRKEHLNIHRSIHSGDKSILCPLCDRTFYRKDHLQKHLQTHTKAEMEFSEVKMEPQEHSEQDCDTSAPNENLLLVKIDPLRPFSCCVCHKTYKRKDHLKLHSYTHMEKDKVCTQCGKAFHKQEQLLAHMVTHEHNVILNPTKRSDDSEGDPLLIECESLLTPRALPQDARPHGCDICGRRFKRRQHLKVHANVHRPNPTIWCSLCSLGFYNNSEFESHDCAAAGQTSDNYIQQDESYTEQDQAYVEQDESYIEQDQAYIKQDQAYVEQDESYVEQEETYNGDMQDEHLDNGDYENYPQGYEQMTVENLTISPLVDLQEEQHLPTPQRVYVCKYCSKPFKRKDHYKIHLHIHTGVRSFFCPDCGKGFYRKDHLQKHSLVHIRARIKPPPRRQPPGLFPISMLNKPEITITAPLNSKLRVPLKIKVPYQMVTAAPNGEQRAVTITPR